MESDYNRENRNNHVGFLLFVGNCEPLITNKFKSLVMIIKAMNLSPTTYYLMGLVKGLWISTFPDKPLFLKGFIVYRESDLTSEGVKTRKTASLSIDP